MTPLETVLIIILIAVTLFLVYNFFRGSTGNNAITRPVESRVDEYLDRTFDQMIEEWSLVRKPELQKFKKNGMTSSILTKNVFRNSRNMRQR